jgi:translation initiation factor 3 subunit F
MTAFKAPRPDALFIDSAQSLVVRVHPLVLLSILDHYQRRSEKDGRVIGTLLGNTVSSVSDSLTISTTGIWGGA